MKRRSKAWILVAPLYLVTIVLVFLPLIYIVALSFLKKDVLWGVTNEWTLGNYRQMLDPVYLKTFVDSLKLAFATTVITTLLGYPFGYFMAKLPPRWRNLCMLLVVVPFWTNALIRIYGWMILLRAKGVLNTALMALGILSQPMKILYTYSAVLIGMVYSLLPFMILPVYNSVEKMDWSLVEASRDLGATAIEAFFTVTLKLTLPGVLSGFVLVFVPSIGLFFISDLLGGGKIMLVGNLIKNQLLQARDWPFGAALSVVMMLLTLLIILLYRKITGAKDLEGFF
ncbi:MAG: ABC transporter permease [Provencibacterium sp.]|jgi:spermidine/putrescine transport system permease protein|nr:ABC transporter permease [Provencibacterium sp.]